MPNKAIWDTLSSLKKTYTKYIYYSVIFVEVDAKLKKEPLVGLTSNWLKCI